jgi:hypothetical protein
MKSWLKFLSVFFLLVFLGLSSSIFQKIFNAIVGENTNNGGKEQFT